MEQERLFLPADIPLPVIEWNHETLAHVLCRRLEALKFVKDSLPVVSPMN
jgi:hypothetical protein